MAPLDLADELIARYQLFALTGLLESVRAALGREEISIAVLGRFKAGKSSFLNHFLGREILPVGVVPVTSAVTEMRYGERAEARVRYRDGREPVVPLAEIAGFIAERENPENRKQVESIGIALPELRRFRSLKFVDTPGLESALEHNTETALAWLPNAGLALVAVSVDPPLSQRDLELLRAVSRYTPKIAVLLTKVDLLSESQLAEVMDFVAAQLAKNLLHPPPIFPYSTRPGFERFRQALDVEFTTGTLQHFTSERHAILTRKLDTLLQECGAYLTLALKSAELADAERSALSRQAMVEKEAVDELKSTVRLVVRHAAAGTRQAVDQRFAAHRQEVQQTLLAAFEREFPRHVMSLAALLSWFEAWLGKALHQELAVRSVQERAALLAPIEAVRKQARRALQQFRDRLSESTQRAFGVSLATTETEIAIAEPANPDIRVGRVFDRNWELLSPILPVWLIRGVVRRHFSRTISYLIYENLSRLGAQWEESINASLDSIDQEARRRLDELLATVERLMASNQEGAPEYRAGLARIEVARKSLAAN